MHTFVANERVALTLAGLFSTGDFCATNDVSRSTRGVLAAEAELSIVRSNVCIVPENEDKMSHRCLFNT